jgi:hypothetical protein
MVLNDRAVRFCMSTVDIKCLREHRALILPLRSCVVVIYRISLTLCQISDAVHCDSAVSDGSCQMHVKKIDFIVCLGSAKSTHTDVLGANSCWINLLVGKLRRSCCQASPV